MSAVNATPDTQNAAVTSAASFLLSLNAGLGGDNAQGKLFTKFLLESQTGQTPSAPASKQVSQSSQTPAQNPVPITDVKSSDIKLPSLPALKNLVSAWRHLVNRLQDHGHDKTALTNAHTNHKQDDAQTPIAADTANVNSTDATSVVTPAITTGIADSSVTASSGDQNTAQADTTGTTSISATDSAAVALPADNGDSDQGNDQTTVSDILKELQVLALLIEKQLQNLQPQAGIDQSGDTASVADGPAPVTSAPTQPADPTQTLVDPSQVFGPVPAANLSLTPPTPTASVAPSTDAADISIFTDTSTGAETPTLTQALTDLLKLVQLAAKQLEGTVNTTSASDNSNTDINVQTADTTTTSPWPTDAQLGADLKVLLDTLRASVSANKGEGAGYNFGVQKVTSNSDVATSDAVAVNLPSAAPDASRNAWMQQDDFLTLFKPGTAHVAAQAAAPVEVPQDQTTTTDNFTAAPVTAGNVAAPVDNKGGASLDLDLNSQDNANTGAKMPLVNTPDNSNLAASANSGSSATTPYSFASQLSEARAANGGLTGLPGAVEQVILKLNRSVKNGDDQMTLQLNPADLGRVNIKLNFSADGKVQGTVVADNPATLHLLLKDVRGLERALQEAGLRADPGSLQFSLGDPSGQQSRQTAQDFASAAPTYNGGDSSTADVVNDLSALTADTSETYYVTPDRVNLRV